MDADDRGGWSRVAQRFNGSLLQDLWRELVALDFINQGILFAGVLLLCFIPFLITVQALVGRSAATNLIRRFGLDDQAADAVRQVLTSPTATSAMVTGVSWLVLVVSGLASAAAVQQLYLNAYRLERRGLRDLARRVLWLAALVVGAGLTAWTQPWLHDSGGPVLLGAFVLVVATGFWWFTMWLMLGGRLAWGELFPAALVTGVCWLGMTIVFRLTMSSSISSNYRKYGSIGVIFAVMTFLIALGVVVILGAVFGVVWRERHGPPALTEDDHAATSIVLSG